MNKYHINLQVGCPDRLKGKVMFSDQRKAAMIVTAAVSLHRVNKALVPLALLWGSSDAKDATTLQRAFTAYMFGTSGVETGRQRFGHFPGF